MRHSWTVIRSISSVILLNGLRNTANAPWEMGRGGGKMGGRGRKIIRGQDGEGRKMVR